MRHRRRSLRRRFGRARSMTYGTLPRFRQFHAALRDSDPETGGPYLERGEKYKIEASRSDEEALESVGVYPTGTGRYGKPKYELSEKQLYSTIRKLAKQWDNEEAQSLASAIMTTLGYEWI